MVELSKGLYRKPDSVWGKSKGKKSDSHNILNASFQSHGAHINLDLIILAKEPSSDGSVSDNTKIPARVYVGSPHGRVNLNIVRPNPPLLLPVQVHSAH